MFEEAWGASGVWLCKSYRGKGRDSKGRENGNNVVDNIDGPHTFIKLICDGLGAE